MYKSALNRFWLPTDGFGNEYASPSTNASDGPTADGGVRLGAFSPGAPRPVPPPVPIVDAVLTETVA